MAEAKEAWSEVGERFGGLGEKLKEHFTRPTSKSDAAGADVVDITDTAPEAPGASDAGTADALKDAFRTLGEALDGAVQAIGAAAKDPAIADDVRQVGQALVNALSTTFTDAGGEVKKAFNRGATPGGSGRAEGGSPSTGASDEPGASGE